MCNDAYGFRQISAGWFLEIEYNWQVVLLAQFIPDGVQNSFSLRSKAAKNKYNFVSNCINDTANGFVVQQEINNAL